MKDVSIPQPQFTPTPDANSAPDSQTQNQGDWLENWMDQLEKYFNGGLREDPADFQKRLVYSPHPSYPDLAKRSGIQGMVVLQVRVTKDGRVEVLKLIQGEPVLADSAIATVKQWRAKPVWSNGKPMEVISTVTFNFQLQ
jgi:protein TonB